MEIYWVISLVPAEGKGAAAKEALLRLVQHVNAKYSQYTHAEILGSMDGADALHYVARTKSLAAHEESLYKVWAADPKSKAWDEESRELFIATKTQTHFYQVLT